MVYKLEETVQSSQDAQDTDTAVQNLGSSHRRLRVPLGAGSPGAHAEDRVPAPDDSVHLHTLAHSGMNNRD